MIAVIDYGAGNLGSVKNALEFLGCEALITSSPARILDADGVILPGVGAAGDTFNALKRLDLVDVIQRIVANTTPFFAICVGLQVLLSTTEEGGGNDCMNVIEGSVRRLPSGIKVPHMGWNQVKQTKPHNIFRDIPDNSNFYFVHSYFADPVDKSLIAGSTEYGIEFCSMIIKDNLIATQFHPEKSGELGLQMYRNFIGMTARRGK